MADPQLKSLWRSCDQALLSIEREVSLLVRCCPTNAASEQQRLLACWQAGKPTLPAWKYGPAPKLDRIAIALERLSQALPTDPISQLYAARAAELELERQLVLLVGTTELRQIASQRFEYPVAQCRQEADALALQWLTLDVGNEEELSPSDDAEHAHSLYSLMCRAIGELRLPFRVVLSDSLSAVAATGEGVIAVARGRALSLSRSRRIVVHEVYGHALPRCRAQAHTLGLLQTGSRWGNDVQEGWALQMEVEHGVLDAERRRELAARHCAAADVAAGANWIETTRALLAVGEELSSAQQLASRAHRAGGLARERIYLPAWCEVRSGLSAEPSLAEWLGAGRLSVDAARVVSSQRSSWA